MKARVIIVIIALLFSGHALAQNGAVVLHPDDWLEGFIDWNDQDDIFVIGSSDAEFFCEDELVDPIFAKATWVIRPDGSIQTRQKYNMYTRVFDGMTFEEFNDDPCAAWNDSRLIAEGISQFRFNDNHVNAYSNPHKRRNSFGFVFNGVLYDLNGNCPSGMVKLHDKWHMLLDKNFPDCESDGSCEHRERWTPPTLHCEE